MQEELSEDTDVVPEELSEGTDVVEEESSEGTDAVERPKTLVQWAQGLGEDEDLGTELASIGRLADSGCACVVVYLWV